ncbi:MAG: hypothetical protein ACRCVN_06465 [Spirochaetia bacterium]
MKKHNTGLFLGVWITDYSLYLNVTDKLHYLVNQAVQTTNQEMSQIYFCRHKMDESR